MMAVRGCGIILTLFFSSFLPAQVLRFPGPDPTGMMNTGPMNLMQASVMDTNLFLIDGVNRSPLQNPTIALSKLDLKAPSKAQHEYEKGYQLLAQNKLPDAIAHLGSAVSIYPDYVAAHNALGSAYMGMRRNQEAKSEFAKAAALDDHLPNSFLNLGCAELALKDYPAAETNIQKASTLAPLDLQLRTALAYSQYMNHDYDAAVATAESVHVRKHPGTAMAHLYAAASLESEKKLPEAEKQVALFLKEDPKSPAAAEAKDMMRDLREEELHPRITTRVGGGDLTLAYDVPITIPEDPELAAQRKKQEDKELAQLVDAEQECPNCSESDDADTLLADARPPSGILPANNHPAGYTFHARSEEVALFFAATDHGKPVTDLQLSDLRLLDNHTIPAAITGFRNEAQLPLRIGLLIDTSDSINKRFKFEQQAAIEFLQKIMNRPDDLAFVVGFANSVLLVQDFSNNEKDLSHAVEELVPAGGTALWNAVAFASDKLSSRAETQPVSRILVVISDGEDNSSSATARQAIQRAQRGEVTVYTISTQELTSPTPENGVGGHALRTLADLTGGAAFEPGSVKYMSSSLHELQDVIRSRYLLSYKPAAFKRNGEYRTISLSAEKDGRKLHVLSRKGYVASPNTAKDPY